MYKTTKHISQECKQKDMLNTSEWLAKVRDLRHGRTRKEKQYLERTGAPGTKPQPPPSGNFIGAPLHSTQGCVGKCDSWLSKGKKFSPGSWCLLIAKVKFLPPWLILSQPCDSWKQFWEMLTFCFCGLLDGVSNVSRWSISWLIILAVTFRKPKYIQPR